MKEAPGPSVSEEIADIFRSYNIDSGFIHNQQIQILPFFLFFLHFATLRTSPLFL